MQQYERGTQGLVRIKVHQDQEQLENQHPTEQHQADGLVLHASLLHLENLGLALQHHEFPPARIMKSHLMSALIGARDTGSRGEIQL